MTLCRRRTILVLLFLASLCALAACAREEKRDEISESQTDPDELNLYNWEDYLLPELLEEFERTQGIRVNLHEYKDEDDILAALQSGLTEADLVVVSGNIVRELNQARLLRTLDPVKIPNLAHVRAHPNNFGGQGGELLAVPYLLGTVGVLVNTEHVPRTRQSWNVLWDPAYKGRIAMLDNSLDVLDAGFKSLLFSINTDDPAKVAAVRTRLLAQRPLLAGYFDPVTLVEKAVSGELWAVQLYSGDARTAMAKNPALRYFVPEEGSTLWIDCFVVPRYAPHPDAAMRFINFMHDPANMARNAEHLWYQPVNAPALGLLSEAMRSSPEVFLPKDVLQRCETTATISPAAMQARLSIWAELQAAE